MYSNPIADSLQKKQFVTIYPISYANTNGLSISLWGEALQSGIRGKDLPTVNGVDLNLNPFAIVAMIGGSAAISALNVNGEWKGNQIQLRKFKRINGLRLGLLQDDPTYVKGFQAHLAGNVWSVVEGVSIGGYCGRHYHLRGLSISTLFNKDFKTRGLQLSLFYNYSEDLKGLQIGLWNKNQTRSLPLINWNF